MNRCWPTILSIVPLRGSYLPLNPCGRHPGLPQSLENYLFQFSFLPLTTFSTPSCVEDHLLLESQCGHTPSPCAFCPDLSLYYSAANRRQSTFIQACCKSSEPPSVKSINSLVIFERDRFVSGCLVLPRYQYYLLSFLVSVEKGFPLCHPRTSDQVRYLSTLIHNSLELLTIFLPNSPRLLVNQS